MKLVGAVANSLSAPPADAVQLGVGERLGGQHVVVHRHGVQPVAPQQARKDVRRQYRPARGDDGAAGIDAQRRSAGIQRSGLGVFVDAHARLGAGAGEFERQLGGIHYRAGVGAEQAGEVGRRMNLSADLAQVQ